MQYPAINITPKQLKVATKVIKEHYHLPRTLTEKQVRDEIGNILRRGCDNLCDDLERLNASLCVTLQLNSLEMLRAK